MSVDNVADGTSGPRSTATLSVSASPSTATMVASVPLGTTGHRSSAGESSGAWSADSIANLYWYALPTWPIRRPP